MSSLYRRNDVYWLSFRYHAKPHCISLGTKDKTTATYLKAQKDKELIEDKSIIPDKNLSCLPILEKYKNEHKYLREAKTNDRQYNRVKLFFEWAHVTSFKHITQDKVKEYLTHRIEDNKISLYTVNTIIQDMKTWLNWCVKNRYLFENPIAYIKQYHLPQHDVRFLNQKEVKTLLEVSRDPSLYIDGMITLYPVIATGIATGMRQQELFNLEWPDIDFKHNLIRIRSKEGFTTKDRENRTVPISSDLRAILKPLAKKSGLCFDTSNHRRIFKRIRAKANLVDIGWHTFRHTFISHALMSRVPPSTVSIWAGHSSLETTMIYRHILPEHEQEEIQKIKLSLH